MMGNSWRFGAQPEEGGVWEAEESQWRSDAILSTIQSCHLLQMNLFFLQQRLAETLGDLHAAPGGW